MSINDQRLAADIAACQSVPDLQQQLHDRDLAIETLAAESAAKSRCLGFFASVIKSGEPWTDTCQKEYEAATASPANAAFIRQVRAEGMELAAKEADKWIGLDLLARELRKKAEALRSGETS